MLVTALVVELWTSGHGKSLYLQFGFVSWLAGGALLLPFFRAIRSPSARDTAAGHRALPRHHAGVRVRSSRARNDSRAGSRHAMLRTLELTFFLLWLSWLVLVGLTAWHLLFGWVARITRPSFRAGLSSARALFTGMLALTLSISIFSQVTILLWAGVAQDIGTDTGSRSAARSRH